MASQWLEEVSRDLLFFPLKHQLNDTESPVLSVLPVLLGSVLVVELLSCVRLFATT